MYWIKYKYFYNNKKKNTYETRRYFTENKCK